MLMQLIARIPIISINNRIAVNMLFVQFGKIFLDNRRNGFEKKTIIQIDNANAKLFRNININELTHFFRCLNNRLFLIIE